MALGGLGGRSSLAPLKKPRVPAVLFRVTRCSGVGKPSSVSRYGSSGDENVDVGSRDPRGMQRASKPRRCRSAKPLQGVITSTRQGQRRCSSTPSDDFTASSAPRGPERACGTCIEVTGQGFVIVRVSRFARSVRARHLDLSRGPPSRR